MGGVLSVKQVKKALTNNLKSEPTETETSAQPEERSRKLTWAARRRFRGRAPAENLQNLGEEDNERVRRRGPVYKSPFRKREEEEGHLPAEIGLKRVLMAL